MLASRNEARELIKQLVKERLFEKVGVQNLVYFGEEVTVIRAEDGLVRFNLPRVRKSYALLSGRLYEREYVNDSPKAAKANHQPSPMATQLNYKGEPEEVDTRVFTNKIICSCGNVRWLKNSDLFQCRSCKPCTLRQRNDRRKSRRD